MRSLFILSLLLSSSGAFAGTLDCSAHGLSYSYDATDGGAPREPFVDLILDGKVLIHERMFEDKTDLATFELAATRNVLKTEKTPDYVTTTFESEATVTKNGETEPAFKGTVLCRESRYVGPPRP